MMGSELGWPSVHIPEAYGGLGMSYIELVALLEVMGGALACAPFLSSVCLGANALLVAGSEAQKQAHLPGIAEGQTRATLGWSGSAGAMAQKASKSPQCDPATASRSAARRRMCSTATPRTC